MDGGAAGGDGMSERPMRRIPIRASREVAERYGYDQIVIYARRVGADPEPSGEHMTTYGITREHYGIAARMRHPTDGRPTNSSPGSPIAPASTVRRP